MEEFIYRNDIYIDQEHRYQLDSIVNELGFDIEYENKYKIIFELSNLGQTTAFLYTTSIFC